MTFLKTDGHLEKFKSEVSAKHYYRVEFDLVIIIQGRDLTFEARWPKKKKRAIPGQREEEREDFGEEFGPPKARGNGQISIAAAFEPGTQ